MSRLSGDAQQFADASPWHSGLPCLCDGFCNESFAARSGESGAMQSVLGNPELVGALRVEPLELVSQIVGSSKDLTQ